MNRIQFITYLIIIFVIIISCNNPNESDTTPPNVTITYPQNGTTVSKILFITCVSTDNEGVKHVELWVDGVSTNVTDNTEPYSLKWNTSVYDDNSTHIITIRSYDKNNNKTDSDPISLIVDNSNFRPSSSEILGVFYRNNYFYIKWSKNLDDDFYSYSLYESVHSDMSDANEILTSTNINDTTFNINGIVLNEYRY